MLRRDTSKNAVWRFGAAWAWESILYRKKSSKLKTILDGRRANRHHKMKHDFPFSGLVSGGHCGCSLVGEIKKGQHIYYHCTGYKGKCLQPYTRISEITVKAHRSQVMRKMKADSLARWSSRIGSFRGTCARGICAVAKRARALEAGAHGAGSRIQLRCCLKMRGRSRSELRPPKTVSK